MQFIVKRLIHTFKEEKLILKARFPLTISDLLTSPDFF
jgi:hypothetical protein